MKSPPGVDDTWQRARGVDAAALDRAGCARQMGDLKRLRAWIDAAEIAVVGRQKMLASQGEAEPADLAGQRCSGRSARTSRDISERETTCGSLPGLGDALGAGDTTSEHIDIIAATARRLPDDVRSEFLAHRDQLLRLATSEPVDVFARRCRQLAKDVMAARAASAEDELEQQRRCSNIRRWTDRQTGMCHTNIALDPVRDAKLAAALDAALRRVRARDQQAGGSPTSFAELQVEALIDAVCSGSGTGAPELAVLISWEALAADAADAGLCCVRQPTSGRSVAGGNPAPGGRLVGTAGAPERPLICETVDGVELPPETVRRLACDAMVYPVVLGNDGIVRDQGRGQRTATADQRRQLAAMHATCGHPHCDVPFSATRAHHVLHWGRHHGETNIDNLLPLCETHHHLVHEGGWTLEMAPGRVATWRLPDGTVYHRGSTIDRLAA